MTTKDALKLCIDSGKMISLGYLEDLTDQELFHRPSPKSNHINWQLGHLIAGEHMMIEQVAPGAMPPLPGGFSDKYTNDTAANNDPKSFLKKSELLKAFEEQRAGTLRALEKTRDSDFDKATGVEYAPTVGAMFALQGTHWVMHAGQWAVIRRQLGRPPLY